MQPVSQLMDANTLERHREDRELCFRQINRSYQPGMQIHVGLPAEAQHGRSDPDWTRLT